MTMREGDRCELFNGGTRVRVVFVGALIKEVASIVGVRLRPRRKNRNVRS